MTKPQKLRSLEDALRENMNLLRELTLRYGSAPSSTPHTGASKSISSPDDVFDLLAPEMAGLPQEQLRVLLLNTKNRVVSQHVIYQGTVNSAQVRAAEVFRPAVIENTPGIIVVHNHPSGDPTPSGEDIIVTGKLVEAGKLLDIQLLDHVVIGKGDFVSLKNKGLM